MLTCLFLLTEDARHGIGILQGGNHLETAETSEHRRFHWRYTKSFAICLGVDAEWDINGVRQQ